MTEKPKRQSLLARRVTKQIEKGERANQWLEDNERCRDNAKIMEKIGEHWQAFSRLETLTGHLPINHELREYRRMKCFRNCEPSKMVHINLELREYRHLYSELQDQLK